MLLVAYHTWYGENVPKHKSTPLAYGIDFTPSIHKLQAVCCKLHNTHGVMERMY